ncbi:MAG: methylated-DNA--[protein]-cysteine S-methyltransferase [Tannerella sp.]|jgi:methylated-DNA-[protein]-cysteine S-methyltransferase|nr:methylated-DNA--[protein]-cysteine S-methyltransferase [Tannerella sp.]
MNTTYYQSPIGTLRISENGAGLTAIEFFFDQPVPPAAGEEETAILKKAVSQLSEYFAGKRKTFDLPLAPQGTPFQLRAWNALREIPYGETRSYKQIAEAIGCPKGPRAVGLANNRNPLPVITPCHRVIGANGQLVGYAGGLDVKKRLLELEGVIL